MPRVLVFVLGDVGRSPRMQYHSLSLAEIGFEVDLVGYKGAEVFPVVSQNPNIHLTLLRPPKWQLPPRGLKFVALAVLKTCYQLAQILSGLCSTPKPDFILVQNPPAIPTLAAVSLVALLRGAKLIVDWHNLGYSLFALSRGDSHPLVRISKLYERFFSRFADGNLCVTGAMQKFLASWGVRSTVLYDTPPHHFRRLTLVQQHELLLRLQAEGGCLHAVALRAQSQRWLPTLPPGAQSNTIFTYVNANGEVCWRPGRPALVVSSTSWTQDEDFSILLNAVEDYDRSAQNDPTLPRVVFLITGRGDLRTYYENKISKMRLDSACIVTAWLSAEDYPRVLGTADVGVSLHTSSSGLDLPMKVVDMYGCNLPVCAIDFPCLSELVTDRLNGRIFKTSQQLSSHLIELLSDFRDGPGPKLQAMREALDHKYTSCRWSSSWQQHAAPLFEPSKKYRTKSWLFLISLIIIPVLLLFLLIKSIF